MAEDEEIEVSEVEESAPAKKETNWVMIAMLVVGIVIVQAGIVMAAIKFFGPHVGNDAAASEKKHEQTAGGEEPAEEEPDSFVTRKVGAIIQTSSDIYINPRGSTKEIVVVSLGIEFTPEEMKKEVQDKLMIPIQDMVISRFSNYSAEELQHKEFRDSLRQILKTELQPYFRGMSEEGKEPVKLKNVFFPKFIIQ